jgi:hypothetical protein
MMTNFFRNSKLETYKLLVEFLHAFSVLECNISSGINFWDAHPNFIHTNLGGGSDQHGECFRQEISMMGK